MPNALIENLRGFVCAVAALLLCGVVLLSPRTASADESSVLLWFVDNTPGVEGPDGSYTPVKDMPGWSEDPDASTLAARVRMDKASGGSVYLDMWYLDEFTQEFIKDLGVQEAWVNGSGQSGVNYSPIPYGVDLDNVTFAVELGNMEYDAGLDNYVWQQTLAWSNLVGGNELFQSGHISPGELSIPDHTPWADMHFTSVPEPTSGLLALLGGLMLALRRPRRRACGGEIERRVAA